MKIMFLKTILRAINQNLELIFIDETSCALQNNNYKDWIGKKEEKEEKIDEKNEDNKNIITTKTDEEKNIIEKESKLKLNH